jgi:hypothetical protein
MKSKSRRSILKHKTHPTQRALDAGESARFSGSSPASTFSVWTALPSSTPAHVTPTVETVEKVPFQKLTFEKWVKNIEERLVFCVPNNILAIFEPVVGDFCESFSNKGFFDSLVSPPRGKNSVQHIQEETRKYL